MPLRLPWVNNIFSMSEQSSQCVTDYRMWRCSTWAVKLRVELWKSLQCYSLHHHYNLIRINNLTGWQIDIWKIKPTKYPSSPSMLVCLVCSVALKKLEMLLKGLIIQIKSYKRRTFLPHVNSRCIFWASKIFSFILSFTQLVSLHSKFHWDYSLVLPNHYLGKTKENLKRDCAT